MKLIILTKHAEERMKQREITQEDIDKVMEFGIVSFSSSGISTKEFGKIKVVYKEKSDIFSIITTYKTDSLLENQIDVLPKPYNWITTQSKQDFITQAYFLREKGLDDEEILEHLKFLYRAVCKEFGEYQNE